MADVVELEFEGGVIEVELPPSEATSRGLDDRITKTFDQALGGVRVLATGIKKTLEAAQPNSMTVQFGLSISGEGNFYIVSGKTVTNLTVTLTWTKPDVN